MSAKNSSAAKKARRAERESRQLKFNPHLQNNTIFHVIPSLQNPDSATRFYGNCASCLMSAHVKEMSEGKYTLLLDHKHNLEFLTQEQMDDIEEAAYQYLKKVEADAEQMAAAAAEELEEEEDEENSGA